MKRIFSTCIMFCLAFNIMAQGTRNIEIPRATSTPSINGIIDAVWDIATKVTIDSTHREEAPTVTAYWKALWHNQALYVLVVVEDDDHWPAWVSGGNWFEYDQVELYLDVNDILKDGFGAGTNQGTGHYQVQPSFSDGGSGTRGFLEASNYRPGGTFCYVLDGENYVFEYSLTYTSFVDKDGTTLSRAAFQALDSIGFDVTIIDQDEGETTSRQRATWHNNGAKDENYANMDDAGTITLVETLTGTSNLQNRNSLSVYPNPVSGNMIINAEFDKLIITNILGNEVRKIETSEKNIDVELLPSGVYIIQVFNRENPVGIAKFYKD